MTLDISDSAPNFRVSTTLGEMDFYAWKGRDWAAMFSCPFAFTPICTTELAALAGRHAEFERLGVKPIVTTVDTLEPYPIWAADIARHYGVEVRYPLIADADRVVARLYGMIGPDAKHLIPALPGRWMKRTADIQVRTLFLISPDNKIALTVSHTPSVGLDFDRLFRAIGCLQAGFG
jgi:peroxiredoxin (alkyl hydroperoxide reductase subunit C)